MACDDPLFAEVKARSRVVGARFLIVKVAGRGLRIGKPPPISSTRSREACGLQVLPQRIASARQDFPGVNLSLGGPGIFCLLGRHFRERKTRILIKFYR
jgi:hypothetical protein